EPGMPLRAGREPDVSRARDPLRDGRAAGPGRQAEGQGEGRDGRSGGRALDPGAVTPSDVLRPRRSEPRDPSAPRSAERSAVPEARGLAPVAVRDAGPAGARAAAGAAVRALGLEEGAR